MGEVNAEFSVELRKHLAHTGQEENVMKLSAQVDVGKKSKERVGDPQRGENSFSMLRARPEH